MNGNPVKDARDLAMQIGGMAPGAAVNVTIWREGAEKNISLTLGEMEGPTPPCRSVAATFGIRPTAR